MQIKRKNIVICSMILLLFIVGFAYNSFTNTKFADAKYDMELGNTPAKSEITDAAQNPANVTAAAGKEAKAANGNAADTASNVKDNEAKGVTVVSETKEPQDAIQSSSFFSEYRMERDKNRSKEVDMWQDIISNENTEKTFKTMAQQEIVKIVALTEKEMIIENLIIARGFNDALVFLTDDSATVIVDAKELTQANVAQIQDIVVRKTKLDPTNIKIMKKS